MPTAAPEITTAEAPAHVTRSLAAPVQPVDCDWSRFREMLNASWRQATEVCNFTVRWLVANDPCERNERGWLKPWKKIGEVPVMTAAYRVCSTAYLDQMHASAIATISRTCVQKYMRERNAAFSEFSQRVSTYKFPQEYPLPASSCWKKLTQHDDGRITVELNLCKQWITVQLRRGKPMWRQLKTAEQMVSGEITPKEFRVSQGARGDVMLRMAFDRPAPTAQKGEGVLTVRTGPEYFLSARIKGRSRNDAWMMNQDHLHGIRERIARYECRRERMNEDMKAETRSGGRSGIQNAVEKMRATHSRWLRSVLHAGTAMLANRAARLHVAIVILDDRDHDYFGDDFPYSEFRSKLSYKLEDRGIKLIHIGEFLDSKKRRDAEAAAAFVLAELESELKKIDEAARRIDEQPSNDEPAK